MTLSCKEPIGTVAVVVVVVPFMCRYLTTGDVTLV